MSNYTIFIDGDKKQVSGSAITATSTKVNGGTAYALGTSVPSGPLTARVGQGIKVVDKYGSQVIQREDVFGAFQSSAVSLTSVANNGSGYCRFTKSSHGLSVGDVLSISGATAASLNVLHVVTAVPTANTFDTRVAYAASSPSAGSYKTVAGTFAGQTAANYIMRGGVSGSVAGGQYTHNAFGSDHGIRRSIHKLEAMRTARVATAIRAGYWNEFTGQFTTDPTVANDISDFGTDHAATPSRTTPGELVYRESGQPDGTYGVKQADYPAKTS